MKNITTLPFNISKTENFFNQLGEYIGDVFYDILPEKGYELRDEQIFMAFQLEQAFKQKNVIFAEAGVGTGKTFVYLLYAICYARYKQMPAIISCADETLIEQLVKKDGDIEKLEKALSLKIDVRLAKARDQYVCVKKIDELLHRNKDNEDILRVYHELPSFVFDSTQSMTSFEKYGDRKDYPWLSNNIWSDVAWDPLQQCSTCDWRHRCGQTLHREHYRKAADLVICSHDFYMEHVWTKESRKREGQLPLLPEASCVVFDEGHLLEFSAQKGLTYRFHSETLTNILTGYLNQDIREESLYLIEDILALHDEWFDLLQNQGKEVEGSSRREILRNKELIEIASSLNEKVSHLLDQLVFDAELFVMEDYHLKIIEEYLEFYSYGLSILLKDDGGIYWLEESAMETSFVIMPRLVEDVLKKEVFSQSIPFVFSSATLSKSGDFSYIAKSLGIENYQSFSVSSPFDYEEQMEVHVHVETEEFEKWQKIKEQLYIFGGKSLILFTSSEEMERFRSWASNQEWSFPIIYEGDEEISKMVKEFQKNEPTVLCSYHLWEGLDVPGPALSQVIISSLPFPPKDPVFEAKRNHTANPIEEVDLPYMLLRLRQGIGRLIRTSQDKGTVHIWMHEQEKQTFGTEISAILPRPLSEI
ncbi:ATP-dependent DNA helicase DinG [Evansella vedderi]|uniref:ATP-dependent DNA helicase DinG n=1 Tax=Evansella vedderi TaxID=38282 RepID=A0ABT9ZUS5_9BACI|nr:ATP-dependent DNA helicase [Evansella vedderi]MDQ0254690.1 ATP-dependent DNA helicase DinG [Evansella vedderi]